MSKRNLKNVKNTCALSVDENKRSIVREVLNRHHDSKFSVKEAILIEKAIYNLCVYLSKKYDDNIEDLYIKYSFEKLGDLAVDSSDEILQDMKCGNIDWDSVVFKAFKLKEEKITEEKIEGPKLKKGEFQCKNKDCKSFECYHYQEQQRSADEGYTTFVVCTKCGHRYKFA